MDASSPDAAAVATAIERLGAVLEEAPPRLLALSEAEAGAPAKGMRWTRKQLVGHLIDSASNNHQRFVRAQQQASMSFPRYVQDEWIAAQGYHERPWGELVELWRLYNRHLLHVMRRVPEAAFANSCIVAADEPETLAYHMADYVVHLEHHLGQILA
jgi:DinB superfamily